MAGRFGTLDGGGTYHTVESATAEILATYKTPATQQKHLANVVARTEELQRLTIQEYVENVALVGQPLYDADDDYVGIGLDTPLGDELPAAINPLTARDLADRLEAALPRVAELAALLRRRGQ